MFDRVCEFSKNDAVIDTIFRMVHKNKKTVYALAGHDLKLTHAFTIVYIKM